MSMKYKFEVKTGDEAGAGTDSNIFVVAYGEYGQLPETRLNGHISGNAFERNKKDTCTIKFDDDVGRIYKIDIRSDCRYAGSSWLLSNVKITRQGPTDEVASNLTSTFNFNRWFGDTKKKSCKVSDESWKANICKYETVTVPYKVYRVFLAPGNSTKFALSEELITGFEETNVVTKKVTTGFNTEMGADKSFSAAMKSAEGLSATKTASAFLKFGFSKGTESTTLNGIISKKQETRTKTVEHTLNNTTDEQKSYYAVYWLTKVNAMVLINSVLAIFSIDSSIEFAGFSETPPEGFDPSKIVEYTG